MVLGNPFEKQDLSANSALWIYPIQVLRPSLHNPFRHFDRRFTLDIGGFFPLSVFAEDWKWLDGQDVYGVITNLPLILLMFSNSIIFVSCDVIALIIQGTGGGVASAHVKTNPAPGGRIMLGGIAFQLGIPKPLLPSTVYSTEDLSTAVIVIYSFLAAEFFVRYLSNKPFHKSDSSTESLTFREPMTCKLKIMSFGITFCTLCLFIRSVYRLIELADGWDGRIIHTEIYFDILDGAMITLAMYSLNFIHPGFFLSQTPPEPKKDTAY
ncbi:hypothetical protein H0H93_011318 [Arthromyces matolae]|nr:hypothetical protein H0H93_011318 [Arthromyces matolae]